MLNLVLLCRTQEIGINQQLIIKIGQDKRTYKHKVLTLKSLDCKRHSPKEHY